MFLYRALCAALVVRIGIYCEPAFNLFHVHQPPIVHHKSHTLALASARALSAQGVRALFFKEKNLFRSHFISVYSYQVLIVVTRLCFHPHHPDACTPTRQRF